MKARGRYQQADVVLSCLCTAQRAVPVEAHGESARLAVPGGRVLTVPARLLADLVDQDLLARTADGFVPTEAGRARARRIAAAAGAHPRHLAQHADLERRRIEGDGSAGEVVVDDSESPLAWLARRRGKDGRPLIGPAAFAAGERLRAQLTIAQMLPRVTSNWGAAVASGRRGAAGGAAEASDAAVAARQKVARALDAVGPELSGLLLDVCGFLKGLEQIERERGWPPRTAKIVLGIALERLATHYGLSDAVAGPARARTRSWRAERAPLRGSGQA